MEMYFWQTGNRTQQHIFDAGLRRRRNGDGITIAAETCGYPKNVYV
jgi:hypothetical protein